MLHRVMFAFAGLMVLVVLGSPAAAFAEEACPNEGVRQTEVYALRLPDCRAYEQVSPVNKGYADALGDYVQVQSSPGGEGVTFFSVLPFPGVPGAKELVTYLSARGGEEWLTQGLVPPSDVGSFVGVVALTEDLADTIVISKEPRLVPGLEPGQFYYYLHDNRTNSYRLLAPGFGTLYFVDASREDSRILFEYSEGQLLPDAAPGVTNLYEWDNGILRLASVLPAAEGGGAPTGGSFAGAGPASEDFYTQNTISQDGSRVFFTDAGTGRIYARENGGVTVPISAGMAQFRAATPDGRYVFYTEAEELYRFDLDSPTPAPERLTIAGAEAQGVLGASEDGSYVYFVAKSKLAGETNSNGEEAMAGGYNLYGLHVGAVEPAFIARLHEGSDEQNWLERILLSQGLPKTSRVAPDGRTVLFTSVNRLTAYDNAGHVELYRYEASSGGLTCVSCNQRATAATSNALVAVTSEMEAASFEPSARNAFLTHNLSSDGSRVFFTSGEALVPEDANNKRDVYEWERGGAGGCNTSSASFNESSGGCLYLISTGRSSGESFFGDADAQGQNVFFFTRQSLVSQDADENSNVYDAREDGGVDAQNPAPPVVPCGGEACRAQAGSPPSFGALSSVALSGAGNLVSPASSSAANTRTKPLTRARKLAQALRSCGRKPKKRRAICEAQARKRYGARSTAKQGGQTASSRRITGGRHA